MRKPWMLAGAGVLVVGALILARAHSLGSLTLGWSVAQLGISAVAMGQHTLLADQIPTRIRARVAAATGVAGSVATVAGAAIVGALPAQRQDLWCVTLAVIAGVLSAALCAAYDDARLTVTPPPLRMRDVVATFWLNPLRYRSFAWAWLCRFCVTMSILTVSLFLYFLIVDTLHVSPDRASSVQAAALIVFVLAGFVATIIAGWASDRSGHRKPIVWASCLLTTVGLALAMLAPGYVGFMVGFAVVGAGQGAFVAVDVAMMTELIPSDRDAGKDLGIVALSYQVPQVLGPLLAAGVLAIMPGHGYRGVFVLALVLSACGALSVIPIKGVR